MASSVEFVEFVCEQIDSVGLVRYKKMFGEYMVYVNDKPVIIVCDDIAYVKIKEGLIDLLKDADTGHPYNGAKEHYVLDIDSKELVIDVVSILESITPVPKPRKKKIV